ncbi:MAG: hypothetical protein HFJ28_06795 [Clostridia bacterium]|nr:hypothetical protein [Clostridia bacterium]
MSKLYSRYSELKKAEPNFVYLFKVGIFYLAIENDAIKLSECLKLNLGKLNETTAKVGFPVSKLDHYVRLMQAHNIPFKIADDTYGIINNYTDYLNNEQLKDIVNQLLALDFDNITFKEGFETLLSVQKDLKKIYSSSKLTTKVS